MDDAEYLRAMGAAGDSSQQPSYNNPPPVPYAPTEASQSSHPGYFVGQYNQGPISFGTYGYYGAPPTHAGGQYNQGPMMPQQMNPMMFGQQPRRDENMATSADVQEVEEISPPKNVKAQKGKGKKKGEGTGKGKGSKKIATPIEVEEDDTLEEEIAGGGKKGQNWNDEEDLNLISAWLNSSYDAVVGTGQSGKTFWGNISKTFNKVTTRVGVKRPPRSCESRFGMINKAVGKFIGCHRRIEVLNQSGKTEADRINDAKRMYEAETGLKFEMEHCWVELKDQPKWRAHAGVDNHLRKKQKSGSGSIPAGSTDPTEDVDDQTGSSRPMGRKKSKARAHNSQMSEWLEKWVEMKAESDGIQKNYYDAMVEIRRREVETLEREKERAYEERILAMDLDSLPPAQRAYYEMKQQDILAALRARRHDSQGGASGSGN